MDRGPYGIELRAIYYDEYDVRTESPYVRYE